MTIYQFIIYKIADYYDTIIIQNKDKYNNCYVRIDKIRRMNSNHLFIEDTAYGKDYEEAYMNLVKMFEEQNTLIRYNELYATSIVRKIINDNKEKYYVQNNIYDRKSESSNDP